MFAFPSVPRRIIEHMFLLNNTPRNNASRNNADANFRLAQVADVVVEFATLGEYRVFVDAAVGCKPGVDREPEVRREQGIEDLWADDVNWTSTPRRREVSCRLPRAHDRGARLALSA